MSMTLKNFDGQSTDAQVEGPLDPRLPLVVLLHGLGGNSGDMTDPLTSRPGTAFVRADRPRLYIDQGFHPFPPVFPPITDIYLDPPATALSSWQQALLAAGFSTVTYSMRGPLKPGDAGQLKALPPGRYRRNPSSSACASRSSHTAEAVSWPARSSRRPRRTRLSWTSSQGRSCSSHCTHRTLARRRIPRRHHRRSARERAAAPEERSVGILRLPHVHPQHGARPLHRRAHHREPDSNHRAGRASSRHQLPHIRRDEYGVRPALGERVYPRLLRPLAGPVPGLPLGDNAVARRLAAGCRELHPARGRVRAFAGGDDTRRPASRAGRLDARTRAWQRRPAGNRRALAPALLRIAHHGTGSITPRLSGTRLCRVR